MWEPFSLPLDTAQIDDKDDATQRTRHLLDVVAKSSDYQVLPSHALDIRRSPLPFPVIQVTQSSHVSKQ